jgi:hypothetical protein
LRSLQQSAWRASIDPPRLAIAIVLSSRDIAAAWGKAAHVVAIFDVVLWLSGYYNGKRNNTIIEPLTINKNEDKINSYCNQHRETTVMDAVKNVLGFDK